MSRGSAEPRQLRPGRWPLLRELGTFGAVGTACFVLDVALFQVLYAIAGVDAVVAKLIATLVSMTAAYLGHRFWSFAHRSPTVGYRGQYLRFAAVNGLTLLLGLGIVAFVRYPLDQTSALVLQAANIGSIVLGTAIRYTAYRFWVFPAGGPVQAGPAPLAPEPADRLVTVVPGVPEAPFRPGTGPDGR